MKFGIRFKIISAYIGIIVLTLLAVGGVLLFVLQQNYLKSVKANLLHEARLVRENLAAQATTPDSLAKKLGQEIQARITIIDRQGKVLGDSNLNISTMENHARRPEIQTALRGGTGTAIRLSDTLSKNMYYLAIPFDLPDRQISGAVRVALPLTQLQAANRQLRLILLFSLLGGIIWATVLGVKLAGTIIGPLEKISEAATRIAAGELQHRVKITSGDEIGELGATINFMAATLADKVSVIAEDHSKLEAILNNMTSGVAAFNELGQLIILNPAAEEIFGVRAAEAIGKHNLEVIRNYALYEKIRRVIKDRRGIIEELRLAHPEERILEAHFAPVRRGKEVTGVLIVFHDITGAMHLDEMRAEFVANVSHELRTPLTAIKGFTETLLDGASENPETRHKFLSIIDREAERLKALLDDILDLSQIESHQIDMSLVRTDLAVIINRSLERLQPQIEAAGLQIRVDLPRTPWPVLGDEAWLEQVLVNLVHNSIKYTPADGLIIIAVDNQGLDSKVRVTDNGIGIPKADQPRIFERFFRVDKARSRQLGGTGLGLAIVKHVVERHGGRVGVESEVGEGATFWFTLKNGA